MYQFGFHSVENGHLAFSFRDLSLVVSPELNVELDGRQRSHVQGGFQVHVGYSGGCVSTLSIYTTLAEQQVALPLLRKTIVIQ